jgi:PAS domain S-box-containing protein
MLAGSDSHHLYRQVTRLAVFVVAYHVAYLYGMTFSQDTPSPLWFPDSVLLCALLFSPHRTWWMYILAQLPIRFLVAVPEGAPAWFLVSCAVNDSLKALLAAFLLLRGSSVDMWFRNPKGFAKYLLVAVVLAPALSAVGGAASRTVLGSDFWTAWRQWFLGDALASLVLTPVLICLMQNAGRFRRASLARYIEVSLMVIGLGAGAYFAFDLEWNSLSPPFFLYLPVPFLLWAAMRFGPLGTSVVLSVISIWATFGALAGRGPFASTSSESLVLSIQLFLLVPTLPFLFLSVMKEQQDRTAAALRESEQRFRSLVDTAPIMVWMCDPRGLCNFFNKPWLDFTGVPIELQYGNGWADCVHPDDRVRSVEDFLLALRERRPFTLEYRLRRYDGEYRWVLDHGTPRYEADGSFLGYFGSCIDITDRREAEEKLRRLPRELMNAQEEERQRIGQELHDDLGQRVVALSMAINYLSQRVGEDAGLRSRFQDLHQESSDIIKGIAQLSHRLRPIALERLGLPAALQDLCEKSARRDGIRIVFNQKGALPKLIPWTVSIALYRVAQEALRNALAHSGSEYIRLDLIVSSLSIVMNVSDRGRGFEAGNDESGLGISGMAEIMKNIGGTLTINSEPDSGTTVSAAVSVSEEARTAVGSARG